MLFLIDATSAQICRPTVDLALHTRTPTNESNKQIKTQTLTSE